MNQHEHNAGTFVPMTTDGHKKSCQNCGYLSTCAIRSREINYCENWKDFLQPPPKLKNQNGEVCDGECEPCGACERTVSDIPTSDPSLTGSQEPTLKEAITKIVQLEAENAELKRKYGFTYCAYCGESFEIDAPESLDAVGKHIGICPKHPMRAVEKELAKAKSTSQDILDVLEDDALALKVADEANEDPSIVLKDINAYRAAVREIVKQKGTPCK
jgi:hypothetical protein